MRRHVALAVGLFAAATVAEARSEGYAVAVELAPLRGAMGQPAVRAEGMPRPDTAVGIWYEASEAAGERDDYKDRRSAFGVEGLFYPLGLGTYPLFMGAGLSQQEAWIGRQEQRDAITWARTDANERHDVWVNHDTYLTATQTVGYRLVTDAYVTASLRLVRDELLATKSSDETGGVRSQAVDLQGPGRAPVTTQVVMHVGLLFR